MAKRNGGDKRGSSADRAARKIWMLKTWGDGKTCPCVHCGRIVDYQTVEADRKVPGGSYRRENVQPSCRPCNVARGDNEDWEGPSRQTQYATVPDRRKTRTAALAGSL